MGLDAANRKGSFARPTIEIYITRMACRNMFLFFCFGKVNGSYGRYINDILSSNNNTGQCWYLLPTSSLLNINEHIDA